jgi:SpoVK/Ycf46/Vps4 family AAA+-type ATPase
MPSATPTEAEVEEWRRLPRDEQLRRLREVFANADGAAASEIMMDEILAEARRRADQRRG